MNNHPYLLQLLADEKTREMERQAREWRQVREAQRVLAELRQEERLRRQVAARRARQRRLDGLMNILRGMVVSFSRMF